MCVFVGACVHVSACVSVCVATMLQGTTYELLSRGALWEVMRERVDAVLAARGFSETWAAIADRAVIGLGQRMFDIQALA